MAHQESVIQVFALFGPPGSGKGTVTQLWQQKEGVLSLSTGMLCRQHIEHKTVHGEEFSRLLANGQLIPDVLISSMVREWLSQHSDHVGVVLFDGYPRTALQVGLWHDMVRQELAGAVCRVVLFDLPDAVVIDRLSRRLTCSNPQCQKIYSLHDGATSCLSCGGALTRRMDDDPAVVAKRLVTYAVGKDALLEACRERGIEVKTFDVSQVSLEEMFSQFLTVIQSF